MPRRPKYISTRLKNLDKARDAWQKKRKLSKLSTSGALEHVESGSVHEDANGPELAPHVACGGSGSNGHDVEPSEPIGDQSDVAPVLQVSGEPETHCNALGEERVGGLPLGLAPAVPGDQANQPPNIENHGPGGLLDERPRARIQAPIPVKVLPFRNSPVTHEIARDALYKLSNILRPPRANGAGYEPTKLNEYSRHRVEIMLSCLRLYTDHNLKWTFTYASEIAAIGAGHGISYGRMVREHIRNFIESDSIPESKHNRATQPDSSHSSPA